MVGACANNEVEVPSSESSAATASSSEMTAEEAKKIASKHLALRQVRWGEPTEVTEDKETYYVHFETPDRELRLIGQRTLLVNKSSGLVTYQKRR